MNISRHNIEVEKIGRLFLRDCLRLDEFLRYARLEARNLSSFHTLVASNVYLAGSVVAPDSPEVARALKLSAEALTAIFAFRLNPPPTDYKLGEGPPLHYEVPPSPRDPDVLTWRQAFHLALIARESRLLDYLYLVTKDTFRESSLVGYSDETFWFMELQKSAWRDSKFGWEPLLTKCEAYEARSSIRSQKEAAEIVRCMNIPYYRVLRKLGEQDSVGFSDELASALTLHKEYCSATKERRVEEVGFVSLQLTALAALAWNRGFRFHVMSDYLPWSWVTGEIFTKSTPATGLIQ